MSNRLGEALIARGVLASEHLDYAAHVAAERGAPLGKVLVELGYASEAQLVAVVAEQLGMPFVEVSPGTVDPMAAELMPRDLAREHCALPVRWSDGSTLVVALADPGNQQALDVVAKVTGMQVVPALAVRTELATAIEHLADASDSAQAAAQSLLTAAPPAVVPAAADAPLPPSLRRLEQPASASASSNGNGRAHAGGNGAAPGAVALAEPASSDGKGNGHSPGAVSTPRLEHEERPTLDLDQALVHLMARGGSDLHLTAGLPPMIRVHGELEPIEGFERNTPEELRKALYAFLTQKQREKFENELELDLSYTLPGKGRFRVNIFQQRDSIGSVMRLIPYEIKSLEDLKIPPQVANFAYLPRGMVLVCGPTGSGKSTTLAAVIDLINSERSSHIMTVEDPIEFLHKHKKSVVNQRELGNDTHSFGQALKHVLRQDPDVILVGEMRDLETIQLALTAAETGHLVFGTLHTQDAPQTIDRVIDVFPPHQQEQVRVMLAAALQGVVVQQLLKTADGQGRVAACEVMVATPAIRNLIREGKTHQMYSSIQAGKQHGMVAMDQSLANLVLQGRVTYDAALERCTNVPDFNRLCGRA